MRIEDTRLPKCVMFGKLVEGSGFVGRQENEWIGGGLDNSSPGRGGIAQDGGTRGLFHGEMECCRENQGWITACSDISEHVRGKTKERIAQSMRIHVGSLTVDC